MDEEKTKRAAAEKKFEKMREKHDQLATDNQHLQEQVGTSDGA